MSKKGKGCARLRGGGTYVSRGLTAQLVVLLLGLCATDISARTVTYYYVDQQGSVLAKTDAQGNLIESDDYRSYGASATDGSPGGVAYAGHVADDDTSLSYMQARYYDPVVGRFLSVDPDPVAAGDNNNSGQSDYLVVAVIWKESGFDPNIKSSSSSATGLMQMTRAAASQVGFSHSQMTDPAKNVQAGTSYMKYWIDRKHGDVAQGLTYYGDRTANYAAPIIKAAEALRLHPEKSVEILSAIHP
jgi:RHS repeat-associated protein